jgi:IS30 family transposase
MSAVTAGRKRKSFPMYVPKGVSMKDLTQADLDAVAARLNSRPRKTLDFDTPADRLQALLR